MIANGKISLENWIAQCSGNIVADMDGEKVLLSIQNGKYYNLGSIGGRIWGLVKCPTTLNQLVEELISEYDVKESECVEEVSSFLELLLDEGLVEIVDKETNSL